MAVATAVRRAWLSDDAYITFRYVSQLLAGHGLVYNAGDRVEGFTHPLWALLLCLGGLAGAPPAPLSLAMSFACIGVLLWLVVADGRAAGGQVSVSLAILVCCPGFIDFTTSGLEVPLSLLLVYLAYRERAVLARPVRVGLCLGLAYLCHPDLAVLALGPALRAGLEARGDRGGRRRALLALGVALAGPPLAYHAFRLGYYGELLPNTYHAKYGGPYWSQGLVYLLDFATYAKLSLLGVAALAVVSVREAASGRGPGRLLGLAGILVHAASVARLGGDFMGQRLLLPDLAAAAALLATAPLGPRGRVPRLLTQAGVVLACVFSIALLPPPPRQRGAIVNERLVYASAFPSPSDAFRGRPQHAEVLVGRRLGRLQDCIGEPTLVGQWDYIGYFGYAAGTRVQIIDAFGLVDRNVARNWAARGDAPRGQPGHERKITSDYVLARGMHFWTTPYDRYNEVMATPVGVLFTLDPRILCAFPTKADKLRELKAALGASTESWDLRTLQMLAQLEARDRTRVEDACVAAPSPARNCFAAMMRPSPDRQDR